MSVMSEPKCVFGAVPQEELNEDRQQERRDKGGYTTPGMPAVLVDGLSTRVPWWVSCRRPCRACHSWPPGVLPSSRENTLRTPVRVNVAELLP